MLNYVKTYLFTSGLITAALLLGGCVTTSPIKQLNIVGTYNQNLDINGSALPTHVRVYQLKSFEPFLALSFNDFAQDQDRMKLGDSAVSVTEHVVDPSRSMPLNPLLEKETNFVAFAALFRKPDSTQWKVIAKRKQLQGEKIFLKVENCYVRIVDHKNEPIILREMLNDRPKQDNTTPDCSVKPLINPEPVPFKSHSSLLKNESSIPKYL